MTPQKKCPHVVHFTVPCNWVETNSWHQKRYSEDGKKFCRCHGLLGRAGLKVNDQLVAYATRFLAVRPKENVWSHHRTLKAKV